jgi:hypothetical protein
MIIRFRIYFMWCRYPFVHIRVHHKPFLIFPSIATLRMNIARCTASLRAIAIVSDVLAFLNFMALVKYCHV